MVECGGGGGDGYITIMHQHDEHIFLLLDAIFDGDAGSEWVVGCFGVWSVIVACVWVPVVTKSLVGGVVSVGVGEWLVLKWASG